MISRFAATIGRLYPFYSGCGSFANSMPFRILDPGGGDDIWTDVCGGRALVPSGDLVGRAMRFVGDLDRKLSWVIDRAVSPGDIALDVGSNLGLVALRLAARVGPAGRVHAFEPQPRLQRYLRETLRANPSAKITLHEVALGQTTERRTLTVPFGNYGAGSLASDGRFETRSGTEKIEVTVRPLSEYAVEIGLSKIDFIKIDVEGFEANVLAGALKILSKARPKIIIIEENTERNSPMPSCLLILRDMEYDVYALPKRLLSVKLVPAGQSFSNDYVAVSRRAPAMTRRALGIT